MLFFGAAWLVYEMLDVYSQIFSVVIKLSQEVEF